MNIIEETLNDIFYPEGGFLGIMLQIAFIVLISIPLFHILKRVFLWVLSWGNKKSNNEVEE